MNYNLYHNKYTTKKYDSLYNPYNVIKTKLT